MLDAQFLLLQLDSSKDQAVRLMGADWLEEQGYKAEASYYRWLVLHQFAPLCGGNHIYWFDHSWLTIRPDWDKYSILPTILFRQLTGDRQESRWSNFLLPHYLREYATKREALKSLRLAYLKITGASP